MQPLPAWLKAPDTLGAIEAGSAAGARNPLNYIAATEAGASAGAHRASLETQFNESAARNLLEAHQQAQQLAIAQMANQREMERAKMEMDARQQTAADQALKEAQRIRIEGAYKDQQLGLQQAHLKIAQDTAQAEASKAAREFAARTKFSSDISSGVSPEKALWNNPDMMTPGAVSAALVSSRPPIPRFDTITESQKIPADAGAEATPAVPAHKVGGFLGFGGSMVPAQDAVPARPATGERTITRSRKVPAGTDVQSGSTAAPSQRDIDVLRKFPNKAAAFDKKFGAGSADSILNPQPASADQTAPDESTPPE